MCLGGTGTISRVLPRNPQDGAAGYSSPVSFLRFRDNASAGEPSRPVLEFVGDRVFELWMGEGLSEPADGGQHLDQLH